MVSPKTGEVLWSVDQIQDPSLSMSSETAEAVDALGTPIVTFNRAKTCEFSAENSLFDLGLYAAQNGAEKKTTGALIPCQEDIEISDLHKVVFTHKPAVAPTEVKVGGKIYKAGLTATGTTFTYDEESKTITFPNEATGVLSYTYEYVAEEGKAISVTGTAKEFPKAGKFIMEVLGCDVCDPETLYHAYLVLPNAKLSTDVDMSFTTDGTHPFTLTAQQAYCDSEKKLFYITVTEE